jgi:ATP-dependent protease ClpP protease subunit
MSGKQAKEYGIVDNVIVQRETEKEASKKKTQESEAE